jgi:hypothetical protein
MPSAEMSAAVMRHWRSASGARGLAAGRAPPQAHVRTAFALLLSRSAPVWMVGRTAAWPTNDARCPALFDQDSPPNSSPIVFMSGHTGGAVIATGGRQQV